MKCTYLFNLAPKTKSILNSIILTPKTKSILERSVALRNQDVISWTPTNPTHLVSAGTVDGSRAEKVEVGGGLVGRLGTVLAARQRQLLVKT